MRSVRVSASNAHGSVTVKAAGHVNENNAVNVILQVFKINGHFNIKEGKQSCTNDRVSKVTFPNPEIFQYVSQLKSLRLKLFMKV